MNKDITCTAGIDTGKDRLDVAVHGGVGPFTVDNTPAGWHSLTAALTEAGVRRIGIEATGGYERGVARHLQGRASASSSCSRCRSARLPNCTCGVPRATASMPF